MHFAREAIESIVGTCHRHTLRPPRSHNHNCTKDYADNDNDVGDVDDSAADNTAAVADDVDKHVGYDARTS